MRVFFLYIYVYIYLEILVGTPKTFNDIVRCFWIIHTKFSQLVVMELIQCILMLYAAGKYFWLTKPDLGPDTYCYN